MPGALDLRHLGSFAQSQIEELCGRYRGAEALMIGKNTRRKTTNEPPDPFLHPQANSLQDGSDTAP